MEDSVQSNLVLVVPSTVEDSEPNALGQPSDNSLGTPSRPLDEVSESVGSEHLASFSCFELSGRERESPSESSESLHIDEGGGDIIPSSPGVMHIDLANTPSVAPFSGLATTTTPCESCESGDMVESAKFDLTEKASKLDENPRKKSDGVMDIDSQEIVIKDVKMSSSQDDTNSPKEELDDPDEKHTSFPEVMESQDYTQEDLNLHLTFESQLFGASSFTNADSPALVIDEQTETQDTLAMTDDRPQNTAMLDSQHKPIISSDEAQNISFRPYHDASADDKCSAGEKSLDLDMPSSHPDSQTGIRIDVDAHDEKASDNLPIHKNQEMTELSEVGSQSAAPPTARGSPSVPHPETSEISQDCGFQDGEVRDDAVVSISASVTIAGSSNSGSESRDRSQPPGKESDSLYPVDESCEIQIVSQSAQDSPMLSSIPSGNFHKDPVTSDRESLPLSSASFKVGKDKEEASPSVRSTYMDENNNRATSQSLAVSEVRNESLDSVISSQPIPSSYDASVSNASMEPDTDVMGLPLSDLETQPYTLTTGEETVEIKTFSQNQQQGRTTKTQDEDQRPRSSNPEQTDLKLKSVENEIRSLINELVGSAVVESSGNTFARTKSTASTSRPPRSGVKGQSSEVTQPDKNVQTNKDQLSKVYDYRSQSQPSQDVDLKSPFRSPTNPPVRERSGGGKRGEKRASKRQMDKDGNNNEKDDQVVANEEHDKSSDTLPPDDSSGHDSDPLVSPPQGSHLSYRVTKTVVIETISNGQVVETRTSHKKPKIYSQDPYSASFSQSSNGSGYLADTSSISRTSSDSSTQTNISQSPGTKLRHLTEPALRSELSGSSTSSASSSSTEFRVPEHPLKAISSPKRRKSSTLDSRPSEKAASPIAIISPSSTITTPVCSISMSSPRLKEGRVVLTPLSTELIAASLGTMGAKFYGDIDTPPTRNINPPLSGSTPVETPQKDVSTSDITSSNSPEIGYQGDSMEGSSFPYDPSPSVGRVKAPRKKENVQETSGRLSFGEGIPVMARLPTESYFYPGMMRAQDPKSGKYSVFFDDDCKERMIREQDVLLIDNLNVGQEVSVHSDADDPSDWYSPGIILGYWREKDERGYVIEKSDTALNTKNGRRYSRKSVIVKQDDLTKEQKSLRVQQLSGMASADVSLDNIVDGKRRTRRSRLGSPAVSSPASSRPGTPSPNTSKTPKSSRKRRISDSQSSGSSSFVPFPSNKKSKRAKLTYGNSKTMTKKKQASETKAQVKYKESKIFENCVFLLTSTTGTDHPSSEFDSSPSEPTHGYDRVDVRRKIVAGSGKVVKIFTELMASDRAQRYIISDDYCRTMNYFNALGAGIICLSHVFINDSTSLGKLKPTESYKLPAGYSLQHQSSVERPSVHIQPLSGLRIHLQMRDIATWSPLLILAGCDTVFSRQDVLKDEYPLACDVVVADASCSATLFERSKQLKIPVVSIEWVIQCLITSEKLPFDGLLQFKQFD